MKLTSRIKPACNFVRLTSSETTECINAEEYYPMNGIFNTSLCRDFLVESDGTSTCLRGGEYLLNGTSDLEVNKQCIITYVLQINEDIIYDTETPHSFSATSKIDNISVTGILNLKTGDRLISRVKSNTANTNVNVNTFLVTYFGGF